jgi:hypothetical protein
VLRRLSPPPHEVLRAGTARSTGCGAPRPAGRGPAQKSKPGSAPGLPPRRSWRQPPSLRGLHLASLLPGSSPARARRCAPRGPNRSARSAASLRCPAALARSRSWRSRIFSLFRSGRAARPSRSSVRLRQLLFGSLPSASTWPSSVPSAFGLGALRARLGPWPLCGPAQRRSSQGRPLAGPLSAPLRCAPALFFPGAAAPSPPRSHAAQNQTPNPTPAPMIL